MASNTFAQAPASVNGAAVTSLSKTFVSACTNPSLIVAACTAEGTAVTQTVADNANAGNYTQDKEGHNSADGTGHGRASVNSIANTSTTTVQVTLTYGSSTAGYLQIYEITNAGGTPVFDSSGSHVSDSGVALSVSITTVAANCSVIGAAGPHYASGAGTDATYTLRFGEAALGVAYHQGEDNVDVGAAGAKTLTWNSYTSSQGHAVVAAAYAPPSVASGPTYPQLERFGHRGAFRGMLH